MTWFQNVKLNGWSLMHSSVMRYVSIQPMVPHALPQMPPLINLHQEAYCICVLKDTPSVMSLGKRCMDEGYSFTWPERRLPYLIAPNGRKIPLIVRDYIRNISLGSPECEPVNDAAARAVSHLLATPLGKHISSTDKRVVYIDEDSGDELEDVLPDDVPTEITGRRRKLHKKARKKFAPKASPARVSDEDEALARGLGLHDAPEPGGMPPAPDVPGGVRGQNREWLQDGEYTSMKACSNPLSTHHRHRPSERMHWTLFRTRNLKVECYGWTTSLMVIIYWMRIWERHCSIRLTRDWIHLFLKIQIYGMYRARHDSY